MQKTLDSWKDSSKNLWRLINSGMSSNSKVGLGYEIQSNNEVLSYEEEMNFSVFNCSEEDSVGKPLYLFDHHTELSVDPGIEISSVLQMLQGLTGGFEEFNWGSDTLEVAMATYSGKEI
ncbi:hypothetical protein Tco_0645972 [Tanacetum coccineum]